MNDLNFTDGSDAKYWHDKVSELEQQVAEVTRENKALRQQQFNMPYTLDEVNEIQQQLAEANVKLKKYGKHRDDCAIHDLQTYIASNETTQRACDCGLKESKP